MGNYLWKKTPIDVQWWTTICVHVIQKLQQYFAILQYPSIRNYYVVYYNNTRFKADEGIMDALIHLRKKGGAGGSKCQRVSPGDAALGYDLC